MTSPVPSPSSAPARYRPEAGPARRTVAVVLSAAAVALIALAVAVLAFFIGNGQAPTVFGQVFGHFALAATITWVLLVVANALGATRVWFLALLAGFASSCLAALIATTFTVAPRRATRSRGRCSSSWSARW